MECGRCPKCATKYGPADVAVYGVLKPRREADGGPWMDYACTSCGRRIRLVPHGQGRYAPPGQPPPRAVPEAERRPPWVNADGAAPSNPPPRDPPPPKPATESAPDSDPTQADPVVITEFSGAVDEACEILGVRVSATRDELEKAFRTRSKTCHPDKVAHLDREFQDLATAKFRRLRAAFDLLSR